MNIKRGSRLLWILMLAAHAPALVAATASLASGESSFATAVWRIASLAAASAFFILKICDVAWLRWHTGPRSLVVITVAVALLHADALRRAAILESATDAGVWQVAMLAGGVSLLAPAIQRRLDHPDSARAPRRVWTRVVRIAAEYVPQHQFAQLLSSCRINRAPPVRAF